MSARTVYICQGGCGIYKESSADLNERGLINERLYCDRCVIHVDAYLKARDDLHTKIAMEWSDGMVELAGRFSSLIKRLPDGG